MRPLLLALPLLLLVLPYPLEAHLEVISPPPSTGAAGRQLLATNECVAKGLQGTCNGCGVSRGGAGPAGICLEHCDNRHGSCFYLPRPPPLTLVPAPTAWFELLPLVCATPGAVLLLQWRGWHRELQAHRHLHLQAHRQLLSNLGHSGAQVRAAAVGVGCGVGGLAGAQ
jgi:hypothetical protein